MVTNVISRLQTNDPLDKEVIKGFANSKADELFPDMLTPEQLLAVRVYRAKRREKKGLSLSEEHQTALDQHRQMRKMLKKSKSLIAGPDGLTDEEREIVSGYVGAKSENGNVVYNGELDFDIMALLNDAEDPVTGTLRDLTIPDKDLPAAKNFYDYCFRVMGGEMRPWIRQLIFGVVYFGEWCPHCTKDKDWVDIHRVPKAHPPEDYPNRVQLLEYGKCPKCGRHKWDLIQNWNLGFYIQLILSLGQRSGKSTMAALLSTYVTHRYLKFPHLATLSKATQASTPLTGTFVSLNFAKSVGVLWTPYRKMIEESDWFQEYHKMLKHEGKRQGRELFRESSLALQYKHKNMRFYPAGPTPNSLRGDTRILAVIDELGLFPAAPDDDGGLDAATESTSQRMNADEMHTSLMNSLVTVSAIQETLLKEGYSAAPPVGLIGVSSPVSQRDKVTRLIAESHTEEGSKTILGFNLATWDINPTIDRTTRFIQALFSKDPVAAKRDFGAEPPLLAYNYLGKEIVGDGLFVNKLNTHRLVPHLDRPGELYGSVIKFMTPQFPGVVAIDAGLSNNSFSIVAGHYDFNQSKIVVSTVLEIMPQVGRKINFDLVYRNVILPVMKDVNAVALLADQWQSIDILHRAVEDMGLNPKGKARLYSKQISPKRRQFDEVKAMMGQKSILLPRMLQEDYNRVYDLRVENYRNEMVEKPVAHLMLQMLTVQDPGPGRAPTKGEGFTDDIWRAYVLLVAGMNEPKIMERLREAREFKYGNTSVASMPVYMSRGYGR